MEKKKGKGNNGLDFDSMLSSNTKAKADKPKKNEMPVLNGLSDDMKSRIERYLEAKKEKKNAEADMKTEEPAIIEFARKAQDKNAFAGNYNGSYNIGGLVKFVTQDRFSCPQDEDVQKEVKKVLGKYYEEIIETEVSVSLKPEVFTNKKLKEELVKIIGSRFSEFFVTETKISVKEGFAQEQYKIAGSQKKLDDIRALLPQYKPSIR